MFDIEDYKKAQRQQVTISGVRNGIVTIKSVKINGKRKMRAVYDVEELGNGDVKIKGKIQLRCTNSQQK